MSKKYVCPERPISAEPITAKITRQQPNTIRLVLRFESHQSTLAPSKGLPVAVSAKTVSRYFPKSNDPTCARRKNNISNTQRSLPPGRLLKYSGR